MVDDGTEGGKGASIGRPISEERSTRGGGHTRRGMMAGQVDPHPMERFFMTSTDTPRSTWSSWDVWKAIRRGEESEALAALRSGSRADGRGGCRALWWAVKNERLEMLEALVAAGANTNAHDPDQRNATALLLAAEAGNLPMVETLLAAGALVDDPCGFGRTPLMAAALHGHAVWMAGTGPSEDRSQAGGGMIARWRIGPIWHWAAPGAQLPQGIRQVVGCRTNPTGPQSGGQNGGGWSPVASAVARQGVARVNGPALPDDHVLAGCAQCATRRTDSAKHPQGDAVGGLSSTMEWGGVRTIGILKQNGAGGGTPQRTDRLKEPPPLSRRMRWT